MSASALPGIAPATFQPSLGVEVNDETDRLEEVYTFMTAQGQPRENSEIGTVESTHEDQEPLAASPAFVYTRQGNTRLSRHPEKRAHKHRDHDAETCCMINSRGGADEGHRFRGKGSHLPLQLQDENMALAPSDGNRTKHI